MFPFSSVGGQLFPALFRPSGDRLPASNHQMKPNFKPLQTENQATELKKWKQLSGEGKWNGLLDPLDIDLRRYIIHYGEMSQATYDCFNFQKWSRHAGNSMFAIKNFFSRVGLENSTVSMYKVTKFLYATSKIEVPEGFLLRSMSREAWNKESNWIGYVAVVDDEGKAAVGRRDIVVAWRGTVEAMEWATDLEFRLVSASEILGDVVGDSKVHHGWLELYTATDSRSKMNEKSARDQVLEEVKRLVELYQDEEISITLTGHSLGAAMATLSAADIVANKLNQPNSRQSEACPVTVVVFASPRVGDRDFQQFCSSRSDLRVLRVRNESDLVPKVSPKGFVDVGEELLIDTTASPYLKETNFPPDWHNLEAYLHMVAGSQGSAGEFKLEIPRAIELINKSMDGVKEEFHVPPCWWTPQNKGMKQMDNGSWKLIDFEDDNS